MELLIIFLLVLLNGLFSMSEIALVSSRKSKLHAEAKKGNIKAQAAYELASSPNRFLSTVQIGITLIGILTGVYSGDTLTEQLAGLISEIPYPFFSEYSKPLAVGGVVLLITYLSLVFGELVPKRIGLSNPEAIAGSVARPMNVLSWLTTPFIVLLGVSSDLVMKLLGVKQAAHSVTEEEVKSLIQEGTSGGVFEEIEQELVENVFQLGDRKISSLMTNRQEIVWLDAEDDVETNKARIFESKHSIYPVCKGTIDNIQGLIYSKDLMGQDLDAVLEDVSPLIREPLYVPESNKAYQVLEKFKEHRVYYGIIVDEYGGVVGIATLHDIMDALVGDISEVEGEEYRIVPREDGKSYLVDAQLPFDEFIAYFSIQLSEYDKKEFTSFNTIGGFVLYQLEEIPVTGQSFEWNTFLFEVVDMDKSRIDKLLISKTSHTKSHTDES